MRSSLPDVLSHHVFMDSSGIFGRALMDLGTTHSNLIKDGSLESRVPADNKRVHPVAQGPGSQLLWRLLETEGSCNLDKVTSDSLQVRLKFTFSYFWVCEVVVAVLSTKSNGHHREISGNN